MQVAGVSKGKNITGWIITGIVSLLFLFGSISCFLKVDSSVKGMGQYGYAASTMTLFGIIELLCAVFYLIPRTAVFGAVLMTAYLGGAVATHIRVGENAMALAPIVFCGLVWLGIYLREPRISHILPLRR